MYFNLEATISVTMLPGFHAKSGSSFRASIGEGSSVAPNEDYDLTQITYDPNGNILSLHRNGYTDSSGTNDMDNLAYSYRSGTNQLASIADSNDNTDPSRYDDIKSQGSSDLTNYNYNSIGQLVSNIQDGIGYEYNAAGLVTKINAFADSNEASSWTNLYEENFSQSQNPDDTFWRFSGYTFPEVPKASFSNRYTLKDSGGSIDIIAIDDVNDDPNGLGGVTYCQEMFTTYGMATSLRMGSATTAKRQFKVVPNKPHKLDLDVIVKHYLNKLTGKVQEPAGAIVTVKDANGLQLGRLTVNSPNPVAELTGDLMCDPFLDQHLSLAFTPTTPTISIEVQRDCSMEGLIFIDNVQLQVGSKPMLSFYYDDRGQRVRKEFTSAMGIETTYYVRDAAGNPMEIVNVPSGRAMTTSEYPVYGLGRLGVYNRQSGTMTYQLTDHLGNVRAVLMKNGTNAVSLVSKTDYYPFGMPMPNRHIESDYRYGYQGEFAEKESELGNGINSFELRLWDARIGRWLTTDPYGQYASPYLGMGNNPIRIIDPDGGKGDDFYKRKSDGAIEWFDGSAEIDGYEHLGVSFSFTDAFNNVTAWGESRYGDIVSWDKDGGLFHHNYTLDEIVISGTRKSSGSINGFNIDKAVNHLNEFALNESQGKCAQYVREALDAGGVTGLRGHATSYYLSGKLENKNFEVASKNLNDLELQKGDIAVFLKTNKKPYGHIAMYNGKQWVSDFKQKSFFVHAEYIRSNTYVIYRIHGIKK